MRLRIFRSCPLITPEDARSALQMLAMAGAMAVPCASIGRLLARRPATLEKLSASDCNRHAPAVRMNPGTAGMQGGRLPPY